MFNDDSYLCPVTDKDAAVGLELLQRLIGPHEETLRKLMGLAKCKTRKQLRALAVDRQGLERLLSGEDERGNVVWRLKDADLASTFGVS